LGNLQLQNRLLPHSSSFKGRN